MRIGTHDLQKRPYLIAEIGSNHDGSLRKARRLVRAAAEAGADAVKFQLFSLETLFQPEAYEKTLGLSDQSWRGTIRRLAFPLQWLLPLRHLSDRLGVHFLCTAFDEQRLAAYLALKPPAVKIASGDVTCTPLLRGAAKARVPVLLSCGAADMLEINHALDIIGRRRTLLLDCVVRYPASISEYGTDRLGILAQETGCGVGLSDHSRSLFLAPLAVFQGALVVERHFTLNNRAQGADHAMAADPSALQSLRSAIDDAAALRRKKREKRTDRKERVFARRAVYAAHAIARGDVFGPHNLICLRPNRGGIGAELWDRLVGRRAGRSYRTGEPISRKALFSE